MFLHYYFDTRTTAQGTHEIHHQGCTRMPPLAQCHYLGMFESPEQAVTMAKVIHAKVMTCKRCLHIYTKQSVRVRHRT